MIKNFIARGLALRTAALALVFAFPCAGLMDEAGAQSRSAEPFSRSPLGIDASTPINISAEDLEMRMDDQVIVYKGDVEITQGKIQLSADKVEIFYQEGEEAEQSGTVRQLKASGNVRVNSPDEQAQGGWAVYNVGDRMLVMGGGVLLTRGANVLKGSRLTIDLAKNVSRLDSAKPQETPAGDTLPSKGRVSGVFVPPSKGDKKDN